jgi:hypothetical protein
VAINDRSRDHRIFVFLVNQGPSGERKKVVNGKMHDKEHDKQNINININVTVTVTVTGLPSTGRYSN